MTKEKQLTKTAVSVDPIASGLKQLKDAASLDSSTVDSDTATSIDVNFSQAVENALAAGAKPSEEVHVVISSHSLGNVGKLVFSVGADVKYYFDPAAKQHHFVGKLVDIAKTVQDTPFIMESDSTSDVSFDVTVSKDDDSISSDSAFLLYEDVADTFVFEPFEVRSRLNEAEVTSASKELVDTDPSLVNFENNEAGAPSQTLARSVSSTVDEESPIPSLPPVAANDQVVINEDTTTILDVLANDSDDQTPLSDLTIHLLFPGSVNGGTVDVIVQDGRQKLEYTPPENFSGSDGIFYSIEDTQGQSSNVAIVGVTITPDSDVQTAVDDNFATDEDTLATFDVLANDVDGSEPIASLSIVLESQTSVHGGNLSVVTIDGHQQVQYTPAANFNGEDSFTYQVLNDENEPSNTATVTITVNPVNDVPVTVNDVAVGDEDTIILVDVLANDIDPETNIADLTLNLPVPVTFNGGTLGLITSTEGVTQITYTPPENYTGSDGFIYSVIDEDGAMSNFSVALITIVPVNDLPTASGDLVATDEDVPVIIDVLANDSDVETATKDLKIDLASTISLNGGDISVVTVNGTEQVLYAPAKDFNGEDTFVYRVVDADGALSSIETVTITVNPVNDAPIAVADSVTAQEDTVTVIDVLANDSDIEEGIENLTINIAESSVNGGSLSVVEIDGVQQVQYMPASNFYGEDSFTYTITDSDGQTSEPVEVNITVNPVNDAPIAVSDIIETDEDTPITIDVQENDWDDSALVGVSLLSSTTANGGTLTIVNIEGIDHVRYEPAADFNGQDSFTYTLLDVEGVESEPATVTINVLPVNDAPIAREDEYLINKDAITVFDVLTNDTDIDTAVGDLTINLVSTTTELEGVLEIVEVDGRQQIQYTPPEDYAGVDGFSYSITDDGGLTSQLVTVRITVNDNPVALPDLVTTDEDTTFVIDVLANDSDDLTAKEDLQIVLFGNTSSNGGGLSLVEVDGYPQIEYTPPSDFSGSDFFVYRLRDENGADSNIISVSVNVNPVNDAPIASPESITIDEDTVSVIDVLANDTDVEDTIDKLSITLPSSTTDNGGTVFVVNVDGHQQVQYTPAANYYGEDSFTYSVVDEGGLVSDSVTVNITINAVNDAPVVVDDYVEVNEDTSVTIDVLANDWDDSSLVGISLSSTSTTNGGTLSIVMIDGKEHIHYEPLADFDGEDSFTYTLVDSEGVESDSATVTVNVLPVNDPPISHFDEQLINKNTVSVFDVLANDVDIDTPKDALTINLPIAFSAAGGLLEVIEVDGVQQVQYTPPFNFTGDDGFTYTITDQEGLTSQVTGVLVVVNQEPQAQGDHVVTNEDEAVTIDVLSNDTDDLTSKEELIIGLVSETTSNGGTVEVVQVNGHQQVQYSPAANFSGEDTFTYKVVDSNGLESEEVVVTVNVAPVNDSPIAVSDAIIIDEDVVTVIDVLSNDTDDESSIDGLSINLISEMSLHGGRLSVVTVDGHQQIEYTPFENYYGEDSFTYSVTDEGGLVSEPVTVNVTINAVNDVPIAVDDVIQTDEDVPITIDVQANDWDDSALVGVSLVSTTTANGGTVSLVTIDGKEHVQYTPGANFNGEDSFTYTLVDVEGNESENATVTINVLPVNDAPVAEGEVVQAIEGEAVVFDVLSNEVDDESAIHDLSINLTSSISTNGGTLLVVEVDGRQQVQYVSADGFVGQDSFAYTVTDASGLTSDEVVTIVTVESGNEPPVLTADSLLVMQNMAGVVDVLANDTDDETVIEDLNINLSSTTSFNGGSLSIVQIDGYQQVMYTPPTDFIGTDSFTYTVIDEGGLESTSATVTVTVNDTPVVHDDAFQMLENTNSVFDVIANDEDLVGGIVGILDAEGNAIAPSGLATPNGHIIIADDGGVPKIVYTPNTDFIGFDQFSYSVVDANGGVSDVAHVTVLVGDPPQLDTNGSDFVQLDSSVTFFQDEVFIQEQLDASMPFVIQDVQESGTYPFSINDGVGTIRFTEESSGSLASLFVWPLLDAKGKYNNFDRQTKDSFKDPTEGADGLITGGIASMHSVIGYYFIGEDGVISNPTILWEYEGTAKNVPSQEVGKVIDREKTLGSIPANQTIGIFMISGLLTSNVSRSRQFDVESVRFDKELSVNDNTNQEIVESLVFEAFVNGGDTLETYSYDDLMPDNTISKSDPAYKEPIGEGQSLTPKDILEGHPFQDHQSVHPVVMYHTAESEYENLQVINQATGEKQVQVVGGIGPTGSIIIAFEDTTPNQVEGGDVTYDFNDFAFILNPDVPVVSNHISGVIAPYLQMQDDKGDIVLVDVTIQDAQHGDRLLLDTANFDVDVDLDSTSDATSDVMMLVYGADGVIKHVDSGVDVRFSNGHQTLDFTMDKDAIDTHLLTLFTPVEIFEFVLRGIKFASDVEQTTLFDRHVTFTATDGDGLQSSLATVTISLDVKPNSAPSVGDDTALVQEGSVVDIDVLANDVDDTTNAEDLIILLSAHTTSEGGKVQVLEDPVTGISYIQYTAPSSAPLSGIDSFTYQLLDSNGNVSSQATVSVTIASLSENAPKVDASGDDFENLDATITLPVNAISESFQESLNTPYLDDQGVIDVKNATDVKSSIGLFEFDQDVIDLGASLVSWQKNSGKEITGGETWLHTVVGYYTVEADGKIVDPQILWESQGNKGGNIIVGDVVDSITANIPTISAGQTIGFYMISGLVTPARAGLPRFDVQSVSFDKDVFITDDNQTIVESLVFEAFTKDNPDVPGNTTETYTYHDLTPDTSAKKNDDVVSGQSLKHKHLLNGDNFGKPYDTNPIRMYHSAELTYKNLELHDGEIHIVAGFSPSGSVVFGFEDLASDQKRNGDGTDNDFNDFVFELFVDPLTLTNIDASFVAPDVHIMDDTGAIVSVDIILSTAFIGDKLLLDIAAIDPLLELSVSSNTLLTLSSKDGSAVDVSLFESVIKSLRLVSEEDSPQGGDRLIDIIAKDGDGLTSIVSTITVHIEAPEDASGRIELVGTEQDDIITVDVDDSQDYHIKGFGNQEGTFDQLGGGKGNDIIEGGAGSDVLWGHQGDDVLIGGAGIDIMHGGQGSDLFILNDGDAENNVLFPDKISDFTPGEDHIDLSGVAGINSFADLTITDISIGIETGIVIANAAANFKMHLTGVTQSSLTEDDFIFV